MADIDVQSTGNDRFRVEVREPSGSSTHDVTCTADHVKEFAPGQPPEVLLETSFRFLLEREPKEAIMRRFELSVIKRYFPEYPQEIRRRLGSG